MHSLFANKIKKICAFTGHRPSHIPGGHDETSPEFRRLRDAIETSVREAVAEGYTVFRSGGAMGFDLWCAETVLRMKREGVPVQLRFILPCETQANHWPEHWRERYFNALASADEVICLQARFDNGCIFRRNRALVDGARLVIAYCDGRLAGGTAYTVKYAISKRVLVRNLYFE